MNSLFNKIDKLKEKISLIGIDERCVIVFAIGSEENWDWEKEEFTGDNDIKMEAYVVSEKLEKYYKEAKNLRELKALGKKYNFRVYVFGTSMSIKEIWNDYE